MLWFATVGPRTDRAIRFDADVKNALAIKDYRIAYRQAQFAYALVPSTERALTLGSLAYLKQDYGSATRHFRYAEKSSASQEREQAELGEAASAAKAGNDKAYRQSRDKLGRPADRTIRISSARAAIDAGDTDTAVRLLGSDRVASGTEAYAKVIGLVGQSQDDLGSARQVLTDAPQAPSTITAGNPSYEAFLRQLNAVPPKSRQILTDTLAAMSQMTSPAAKRVRFSEAVYSLGEFRLAENLALAGVKEEPAYRDGWDALAASQISLADYKAATRSLKTATDLDRGFGYTWYLKSELARLQNDDKKAEDYRNRAKALGYTNIP